MPAQDKAEHPGGCSALCLETRICGPGRSVCASEPLKGGTRAGRGHPLSARVSCLLPLVHPRQEISQDEPGGGAEGGEGHLPRPGILRGYDDQGGGHHEAQDAVEGRGVMPPEEPGHQPCKQGDGQKHPRQGGGEDQEVQPGQPLQHGLVEPQGHHHGGGGHAGDHHPHAPQGPAEVVPPEAGLHLDADHPADVEQPGEHRRRAEEEAPPGGGGAALLPRLPEQGGGGARDQADEEPGGGRGGEGDGGGDALGKAHEARRPAQPQGDEHFPVLRHRPPGPGQHLHKGPVDVEHHRQHPAGNPRQNGPRADQHAAEEVPEPVGPPLLPFVHRPVSPSRPV